MGLTRIRAQQISNIDCKQAVRVVTTTNIANLAGNATDFGDLSFGANGARYGGFCSSANGGTQ